MCKLHLYYQYVLFDVASVDVHSYTVYVPVAI